MLTLFPHTGRSFLACFRSLYQISFLLATQPTICPSTLYSPLECASVRKMSNYSDLVLIRKLCGRVGVNVEKARRVRWESFPLPSLRGLRHPFSLLHKTRSERRHSLSDHCQKSIGHVFRRHGLRFTTPLADGSKDGPTRGYSKEFF
jgi:hypothetical protein